MSDHVPEFESRTQQFAARSLRPASRIPKSGILFADGHNLLLCAHTAQFMHPMKRGFHAHKYGESAFPGP